MHLTCTNQSKEVCDAGLAGAKEAGICNIVALRGDPPKGQDKWEVTEGGFACALDLVKYMRTNYGDYFSIQAPLPPADAQRTAPRRAGTPHHPSRRTRIIPHRPHLHPHPAPAPRAPRAGSPSGLLTLSTSLSSPPPSLHLLPFYIPSLHLLSGFARAGCRLP